MVQQCLLLAVDIETFLNSVLGIDLAGDDLRHTIECGDSAVAVEQILYSACQACDTAHHLHCLDLQCIELCLINCRCILQSSSCMLCEYRNDFIACHILNEVNCCSTLLRIIPCLLCDEVAHGETADEICALAAALARQICDIELIQLVLIQCGRIICVALACTDNAADLPGTIQQECCLAFREGCECLIICCTECIVREITLLIEILDIVHAGNPRLSDFIISACRNLQMIFRGFMVEDAVLPPVMRNVAEGSGVYRHP